jgi:hypothetical protein
MNKEYLGDAVYACFDPLTGDLVLTTEDGYSVTNRIVLEDAVMQNLLEFIKRGEA